MQGLDSVLSVSLLSSSGNSRDSSEADDLKKARARAVSLRITLQNKDSTTTTHSQSDLKQMAAEVRKVKKKLLMTARPSQDNSVKTLAQQNKQH